MYYNAIRFEEREIVPLMSQQELDKLVIQYHIKDIKAYLRGEEAQESARRSFVELQSIGLTPYEIAKRAKCRLKDLIFA
ncbi:hypothetical protein [Photobacterium damselae]|uniref:Uncharacterized protein n=1 Tax=Photobacterium damselae TaxID=38293 RepID=A0A2X1ZLG5_PHODM|nr:hypothetical protein [Photobacterium damselae]SPY45185.1 Uncharacterised protein [Photobacterium damselae]